MEAFKADSHGIIEGETYTLKEVTLTKRESPIARLEREKAEQIQQLRPADKIMADIAKLEEKRAQLENDLAQEVQRLVDADWKVSDLKRYNIDVQPGVKKSKQTKDAVSQNRADQYNPATETNA